MKYFVTSDIHSFYDEFISGLNRSGFDLNNPDHILIVCGDIFDRGTKPKEIYHFLRYILPKNRRILIRGNHEFLLKELVERGFALRHDMSNGTYDTLLRLGGSSYNQFQRELIEFYETEDLWNKIELIEEETTKKTQFFFKNEEVAEIITWIFSDDWVNFYELGPYIFVHSFVPTVTTWDCQKNEEIIRVPMKWRDCTISEWEGATWGCPWKMALATKKSRALKGKIVVCGHWHTSDFWNHLDGLSMDSYIENPIYKSDFLPSIIGLDACTAATKGTNVFVINEDMSSECFNHPIEK